MDTAFFGVLWLMLHFYSFYLPKGALSKEQVHNFARFVEFFVSVLPCGGCSYHATRYLMEHADSLTKCTTGQQLFEWTVTFHNHVNKTNRHRELSFVEAESALLMHMMGRSDEQYEIEDRHTNEQLKIRKWKRKLLILQAKTHKIQTETTDAQLTQMFAHQHTNMSLESYDAMFRGFFIVAMEYNFDKPAATHTLQSMHEFLRFGMMLFPNAKVALDSVAFYRENKPHFVNGSDIFKYVVQWHNHITGQSETNDETLQDMRGWADRVMKRQLAMHGMTLEHTKTIRKLEAEYETAFAQKQQEDASKASPVDTKHSQTKVSTTVIILSCVVLVLLILLVVFIALYSKRKTPTFTQSIITQ